ncbi:MAG: hypothetical protein AAF191_12985, partial [Verrucomicrobiota bacterium]
MDSPVFYDFWVRLAFLAVLLVCVSAGEWMLKRGAAIRWKEYGFLLASLAIGALYGVGVDQITSRISQDYFLLLKGLNREFFAQEIISLGAKAGIAASAVAAGVILLVHRPTRDCFGWGRLFQVLRFPIV